MSRRRILSLWFPRLAAERLLRVDRALSDAPLAVVTDQGNLQLVTSLSALAQGEGLRPGMALADARALCPTLVTRRSSPLAEAAFLTALRRWAGKFSPWVAEEGSDALVIDLTGCAHLFGGEAALVAQAEADCADLGLTVQAGLADTRGAAWALARFAGQGGGSNRSGDVIDQEARATRARAARRHWTRGGAAPRQAAPVSAAGRIAPPGQTRSAIAGLPVAALRLPPDTCAQFLRLGLRQVGDLLGTPRAALARRFGRDVVKRLDQALGMEPEPVAPARPPHHFATRLTLPDPIGLEADLAAAIDRLLPPLCARLHGAGMGARTVRLQVFRTDHSQQALDIGLARPGADPDQITPLLRLRLSEIEAGFGIDTVRLSAPQAEPLPPVQHRGQIEVTGATVARMSDPRDSRMADLVSRLGTRVGLEAITCLRPANSHIPEKAVQVLAAAWAGDPPDWPSPATPRPALLFPPEPLGDAPETPTPPARFRWRRQDLAMTHAEGPERIAPEWWFDDPAWRSGQRDYWRVTTDKGLRLWLYFAHGGLTSGGWFCHGAFA